MNIFTEEDKRFYQWLSLITEPQKIKLFITDGVIEVHCGDRPQAGKLWRKAPILKLGQGTLKHLDIWVNGRMCLSTRFPPNLDDVLKKCR